MIRLLLLGVLLLVIAVLARASVENTGDRPPEAQAREPVTVGVITLEEIREAADLVVLHLPFQQLVESKISGYSGGIRCVVMASGDAMIATDLELAQMHIDEGRVVKLTLPQPRVLAAGLDHAETRVVLIDRIGLWQVLPGETGEGRVLELALSNAQQAMQRHAAEQRHQARARERAETVLRTLLAERGHGLEVEWEPGR